MVSARMELDFIGDHDFDFIEEIFKDDNSKRNVSQSLNLSILLYISFSISFLNK